VDAYLVCQHLAVVFKGEKVLKYP